MARKTAEDKQETYRKLLNYIDNNTSNPDVLLRKQFSIYRLLSQTYAAAGDIEKAIDVEKRLLNNPDIKENYLTTNSGISLVLNHITNLIEVGRFQEARDQLQLLPQKIKLNMPSIQIEQKYGFGKQTNYQNKNLLR